MQKKDFKVRFAIIFRTLTKNWQSNLQWKICLIVNRIAQYIFLVVFAFHKVSALKKVQKQITQKNPRKCALERKSKLRKRHTLAIYGQAGCTAAGHFLLL